MEGNYQNRRWRQITPELQQTAWQLREAMTPAEQVLWEVLRDKKLNGLKFRRQHPVEQFVLDFYCPRFKLALELDGSVHDTQGEQDAARTAHLEARGYSVIRFRNEEVRENLPDVLKRILIAIAEKIPSSPQ